MDLTELQRRVDRYVKVDLRSFYDAYLASGGGDIDGFLTFLAEARAVDPAVLKELHGMGDVETPSLQDPAYQGTLLATWAKTATVRATRRGPGSPTAGAPSAFALPDPAAGSDVRFKPVSRLGEGAMGAVDIARDVYLRRKVALKTVLPEMAGQPEIFGRFLSEMQITAQLEHPNIVPVYALDVSTDGSLGYAMKLVQGKDLETILSEARERIEKGLPLGEEHTLEKRLEHFIKVCDALEYAHNKGIVHRDLKPSNIMIGRHNEVYLMDWGIARPIGAGGQVLDAGFTAPDERELSPRDVGRTRIGEAIGTPPYMSPEQASGRNPELDGKSDQYSMGLILQECVTLKTAVDGPTVHAVLLKAMQGVRDPVPVGDGPGALPREIDAIVRRATQREAKDRYPSVGALADDVRRYLRGEAVQALPEGAMRRAGRWLSRHRMATLTLLLAIGLVGAGGTIGALVSGQAKIAREHARELHASQMAAESAIRTQALDRNLTRYEAALSELVGAAQVVLSRLPASDAGPYFEESFRAKETAPPDFGPSKRYGHDVSVLAPLTSLAPDTPREPIEPLLRSLTLLDPPFRALFLESSGAEWRAMSPPAQRALIADVGVPVFRASIVLREGVTLSFPGTAGPAPADGRKSAEYGRAEGKAGVVWGTPATVDGEAILQASAALHDERGAFRGVALLEVSLTRLLARTTAEELDYVQSRLLVGRDGKIVAEDNKAGGRVPIAPEVAAAIAAGKSGSLVAEVNGHRYRYTFHPLTSVDWYYISAAEEERMEDTKEKVVVTSEPRKPIAAPAPTPSQKAAVASPPPAATHAAPVAEADAGQEAPADAGAEADTSADAGLAPDAGLAGRKPGPMPKPAGASSGEPVMPALPFEKWKVYERKKSQ